jgi:hypothetical protein
MYKWGHELHSDIFVNQNSNNKMTKNTNNRQVWAKEKKRKGNEMLFYKVIVTWNFFSSLNATQQCQYKNIN